MNLSFMSTKGGSGKSTSTLLVATNLAFHYKKKVRIIDFDEPQYSLYRKWERDVKTASSKGSLRKIIDYWVEHGSGEYMLDIVKVDRDNVESVINEGADKYDYTFIDFQGIADPFNQAICMRYIDRVFIPISSNAFEEEPAYRLATILLELKERSKSLGEGKQATYEVLLAKVKVKNDSWSAYKRLTNGVESFSEEHSMPLLGGYIKDRSSFRSATNFNLLKPFKKADAPKLFEMIDSIV